MVKYTIFIGMALVLMFILGCQSTDKQKIGIIAPLSGNVAELGQHVQRGIDLANENLGEKYTLVYEDDKCTDTKAALSAAQKFHTIDGIKLVIGPLCAPAYQAVSGYFNQNSIGFMHTSGIKQDFIDSSGEYGIPGMTTTFEHEDQFLSQHIYENLNKRKIGVFVWNQEWALSHGNGIVKHFERLGGEIVFDETFEISDKNFRTSMLKLLESEAEGVFIVGVNFQTAEIVKQLRLLDKKILIFSQFEIEDPAFLNAAGESAKGVIYPYPIIKSKSGKSSTFVTDYKTKYSEDPNYYAYVGYDSLMLYDHSISECKGIFPKCVISTILQLELFDGVSGEFHFNKDKVLMREFEIREIN